MEQATHTAINWLDRQDIVEILERYGFACHDSETTDELRDALRVNVEDGTVDVQDLGEGPSPF